MRRLYLGSTLIFWLALAFFWAASVWFPRPGAEVVAADKSYNLAEVARHAGKNDCWMAIGKDVYDLTAYLPQHPSDPAVVLPWCGRDATEAYRTKTKGRPHSPYADQLLPKYRIGTLAR